ncbi:MAG: hypothetical protein ACK5YA_01220 [bacterium]
MNTVNYSFNSAIKNKDNNSLHESNSLTYSNSTSKWDDNNMYRTSYYNQSRYNVRKKLIKFHKLI